ncbi:hypothetical protein AB1K18_27775 [Peribacillus simplex]|uniref:hypothetical protein n=1 Tax=Peribacillus simplex TaxID=1478 RepID=UPI003B8E6ED5
MYASDEPLVKDAFTMYFLPVSNYSMNDLINSNYTYYPFRWNYGNVRLPGTKDFAELEDVPIRFSRSENVLVSNIHIYVDVLIHWIKQSHPAYGLKVEDVYSYLYQKYLKLQPYLSSEIENFYVKNMKSNQHHCIDGSNEEHKIGVLGSSTHQRIHRLVFKKRRGSVMSHTFPSFSTCPYFLESIEAFYRADCN